MFVISISEKTIPLVIPIRRKTLTTTENAIIIIQILYSVIPDEVIESINN